MTLMLVLLIVLIRVSGQSETSSVYLCSLSETLKVVPKVINVVFKHSVTLASAVKKDINTIKPQMNYMWK